MYERFVKFYKLQSTNQKSLCKTFADRACQLQFVDHCIQLTNDEQSDEPTELSTSVLNRKPVLLHEKTFESAIALKETIDGIDKTQAVSDAYDYGIAVGSLVFRAITSQQMADIHSILSKEVADLSVENLLSHCYKFSKLQKTNSYNMAVSYRVGETVVIKV